MQKYLVLRRGKKLGPFTIDQLTKMRSAGNYDSLTRIAPEDEPDAWQSLDAFLKQRENQLRQPKAAEPPSFFGATDGTLAATDVIPPFPVIPLLLLHFLTLGIFTFLWMLSRHGTLPKYRADDPSAAKAIGLCFVPFYNLYWIVVVMVRLVDRGNQLAATLRIGSAVPRALAFIVAALYLIPAGLSLIGSIIWAAIMFSPNPPVEETSFIFFVMPQILTLINYLLALPIFVGMFQSQLNSCFRKQLLQLLSND